VTSSWTYDKRGRVASEYSDAAGTKYYSYLPTGELVQGIQNATSIADKNATWSVFKLGAFGRVVERDDNRFVLQVTDSCQQTTAVTDVTTYQFDTAYQGLTGRYGAATAGLMTAAAGGVPLDQIRTRIQEDGGRGLVIVDYTLLPSVVDAQAAFKALHKAGGSLNIPVEGYYAPKTNRPGRAYLAVPYELAPDAVLRQLRAQDLPIVLTLVHPAQ
jgi:hypothetical protein